MVCVTTAVPPSSAVVGSEVSRRSSEAPVLGSEASVITIQVAPTVEWGAKATITGKVRPPAGTSAKGIKVTLQRKLLSYGWHSVKSTRTKARGKYSFSVAQRATVSYRIKVAPAPGRAKAVSRAAKSLIAAPDAEARDVYMSELDRWVRWAIRQAAKYGSPDLGTDTSSYYLLATPFEAKVEGTYAVIPDMDIASPKEPNGVVGFTAYLRKVKGKWREVIGTQSTVLCHLVDGQGWPASIVPLCAERGPDGPERAPR